MTTIELARQYGIEDGMEIGWRKGMELGMELGWKKGMEKAERILAERKLTEEKRTIALKLKKMGMSTADIFKAVGLSIKEIELL